MKILFLIFHGFDPNNGISKKISYQIKAFRECGHECHICHMEENKEKYRVVDDLIISNYGSGFLSKIRKRTEFTSIVNYAINKNVDFVYIRSNHNANLFTINMVNKFKKAGMKVVMEIPTYPYDHEYIYKTMRGQLFQDKFFRKTMAKHLDAIVTFSEDDYIFGQQTIKISNGIDFDNVKIKNKKRENKNEIHLIGVAEIHRWHGFDRLIKGLYEYYSHAQERDVYFHIVGYFFSPIEKEEITDLIRNYHLEQHVILHGKMHGKDLDKMFDLCDFGIGSLGRHRVNVKEIKTLKNREYAARGIPFIYSETDRDFECMPYILKAPADESPIDINRILSFYDNLSITPELIRSSIYHLSWKNQMSKVLEGIYPEKYEQVQKRIAYCIPSLNSAGGMERVLTTKANYLVDNMGYEVIIITTDNKEKTPFFKLSQKIRIIPLDVNIDSLWLYPLWKRLFLYHFKMKEYKKKLSWCLNRYKPNITVSLLNREINFLCNINDGSKKIGEIHFGRYKYREVNIKFLPPIINKCITHIWMNNFQQKIKRLHRFVVLTNEDASHWGDLDNLIIIPNPLTIKNEGLPNYDAKRVIAVGRYTEQKGYDLLITSWKKVIINDPEWVLHIFGEGDSNKLNTLIRKYHLEKSIICHKVTKNISEEYRRSSIFVLSSIFEGMPLVLMEAMAVGLPVVSFACPCGPRDIIQDGIDGFLCEELNTDGLAKSLCKLISDRNLRMTMGKNAAQNIQRYNIDLVMKKWDNLFNETIQSSC